MEQLVDYSVMTGVDILMVSVLLVNTVQGDILGPWHGGSDKVRKVAIGLLTQVKSQAQ